MKSLARQIEELQDVQPKELDVDTEDLQVHDAPNDAVSENLESGRIDAVAVANEQSRIADREKGTAILKQMRLWDSIMDARIKIQKAAGNANLLPNPSAADAYRAISENSPALVDSVLQAGLELSEDIRVLEEVLTGTEGIMTPSRKRQKHDSTGTTAPLNPGHDLTFATESFARLEASLHAHQVQTLQKWSAKVQSVTPSALLPSKHTTFRQQNITPESAIKIIADALDEGSVGKAKAIGRTRVRRGYIQPRLSLDAKGDVSFGSSVEGAAQEGDAEIFDDTDFYQEMLRDVIHMKSGNANADGLEPTQRKKTKKVVDTKASKGRKLGYEVHEKLQNFMVPAPPRGGWHDEQIDELFASLMGKGSSQGEEAPGTAVVASDALRVF